MSYTIRCILISHFISVLVVLNCLVSDRKENGWPGYDSSTADGGDLAESIKCSASDRLGDLVPQVQARTFPGVFHDMVLLGHCRENFFPFFQNIPAHQSQRSYICKKKFLSIASDPCRCQLATYTGQWSVAIVSSSRSACVWSRDCPAPTRCHSQQQNGSATEMSSLLLRDAVTLR